MLNVSKELFIHTGYIKNKEKDKWIIYSNQIKVNSIFIHSPNTFLVQNPPTKKRNINIMIFVIIQYQDVR